MADFINTLDVLGDEAVIDSLINRTITEFKDNAVTKIGERSFYDCANLETIAFPNVTEIEGHAFRKCISLKEITPDTFPSVVSQKYMYGNAHYFYECTALETVDWPTVTSIDGTGLFAKCTSLKSVNMPDITYFHMQNTGVFESCTSLESVNLPKLTEVVNRMFTGCSSLERIVLPSVTKCNCGYALGSAGVTIVDLPVCTNLGGSNAFRNTRNLIALILRSQTVCTFTNNTATFDDGAIANGTGYIYVPSALVDSYKAATNWSAYAAQFRALEDYTVDGTITGDFDETKI